MSLEFFASVIGGAAIVGVIVWVCFRTIERCPHCGSAWFSIALERPSEDDDGAYQDCVCHSCGENFTFFLHYTDFH